MPQLSKYVLAPLVVLSAVIAFGGCSIAHPVAFENPTYSVPKAAIAQTQAVSLVVVLDQETLSRVYAVRSFATGYANKWEIEPGQMLKDVVLIEFPQAFGPTDIVTSYREPDRAKPSLTLELTIPNFVFANFHATVDVRAVCYRAGKEVAFDKTYHAEGFTQGTKMFTGGAFAMKSAIRQSSLDAYKKVFVDLRSDIATAFASVPAAP